MKIHSDTLTVKDIYDATSARGMVGVTLSRCESAGSRSRARSFDVILEGNSRRRPNNGSSGAGSGYAATWDEWGVFINALFEKDPDAIIGYYRHGCEGFRDVTYLRFDSMDGATAAAHDHRWENDGYGIQTCRTKSCTAQFNSEGLR